jgi:hypothetical protein
MEQKDEGFSFGTMSKKRSPPSSKTCTTHNQKAPPPDVNIRLLAVRLV